MPGSPGSPVGPGVLPAAPSLGGVTSAARRRGWACGKGRGERDGAGRARAERAGSSAPPALLPGEGLRSPAAVEVRSPPDRTHRLLYTCSNPASSELRLSYPFSPRPFVFSLYFSVCLEGHARGGATLMYPQAPPALGGRGQGQREHAFVQVPQLLPAFVLSSRRKVLHTKGVRACFFAGSG